MFTITDTIEIDRPVEGVFALAGDYRRDPRWRRGVTGMELTPDSAPGVGAVTRETLRSFGRSTVTVAEVVAFDVGERTAFRSLEGPIACDGYRHFAATGTGTRFTYSLTLRPVGWMRAVEFLLKPIFRRQIRGDLLRLKTLLETNDAR